MMFSLPTTALATEYGPADSHTENYAPSVVSYNEFDLVKELAQKTPYELECEGYTLNEIMDIKNYQENFADHIDMLNTLPDEVLTLHGYTQSQINMIRNFDGSEAEMQLLAASVKINAVTAYFTFDGNYTTGRLAYTWEWIGVPNFKMRDIIAFSWNTWTVTENMSEISYYHINTGDAYKSLPGEYHDDGNKTEGACHKFAVLLDDYYYAKRGVGRFEVKSDVHAMKDFYCYIEYGHSQIVMSWPTFSIGSSGTDASIRFSLGVVTAGAQNVEYIFEAQ